MINGRRCYEAKRTAKPAVLNPSSAVQRAQQVAAQEDQGEAMTAVDRLAD